MMKNTVKIITAGLCLLIAAGCAAKKVNEETSNKAKHELTIQQRAKLDSAYFAEGCFWCAEEVFQRVKGVQEAVSGYSGGTQPNPTYQKVSSETTDYAESLKVFYDPDVVDYRTLVKVFFGSQDPTQANGQGPDIGKSYRSIIFYQNKEQERIAKDVKQKLAASGQYDKPLAVEITSFKKFYKAEDYHQEYFTNHPNNPYIVHESKPRVKRFMNRFPDLLKDDYKTE